MGCVSPQKLSKKVDNSNDTTASSKYSLTSNLTKSTPKSHKNYGGIKNLQSVGKNVYLFKKTVLSLLEETSKVKIWKENNKQRRTFDNFFHYQCPKIEMSSYFQIIQTIDSLTSNTSYIIYKDFIDCFLFGNQYIIPHFFRSQSLWRITQNDNSKFFSLNFENSVQKLQDYDENLFGFTINWHNFITSQKDQSQLEGESERRNQFR